MRVKIREGSAHQVALFKAIKKIFKEDIVNNTRGDFHNPFTGVYFEIDIWIPELKLGFEFQDAHHYTTTWYHQTSVRIIQQRDNLKKEVIGGMGGTLIDIPCWWNMRSSSLVETINFYRPDLFQSTSNHRIIIPLNPPSHTFLSKDFNIPMIHQLMLASFRDTSLHQDQFISSRNQWWVGEKYDGIRFCWHPIFHEVYSRTGRTIDIPVSFVKHFPSCFLDCEFWCGRGQFFVAQQLAYMDINTINLSSLRAVTFDEASLGMETSIFETRYKKILTITPLDHPFIILAFRKLFNEYKKLLATAKQILKQGGEGLILRKPLSLYERGRNLSLFKLKAARNDGEALLVNREGDTLTLQLPDNQLFEVKVGEENHLITNFTIGSILSFECELYTTQGIPINAKLTRVRRDVSWDELVGQHLSGNTSTVLNRSARVTNDTSPSHRGGGGGGGHSQVSLWRKIFIKIAKDRKFDPLVAANWYGFSRGDIQFKEGRRVATSAALMAAFPSVEFDVSKFKTKSSKYYKSIENQKKTFEEVANSEGFDPLVAENWYHLSARTIYKYPGARVTTTYYHKNYQQALIHIFPSIGIDLSKFNFQHYIEFEKLEKRREFMDAVCSSRNFDPLNVENWYTVLFPDLLTWHERMPGIFRYYKKDMYSAIAEIYPELSYDPHDISNQKKLFDAFAAKNNFDPLVPSNWYPRSRKLKENFQYHFKTKVQLKLVEVYPDIGF